MEFAEIAGVIYDLGTIGVLSYFVIAFVTGKIVSSKTHEEQVKLGTDLAQKILTNGFKTTVQEAVKHGFIEAWHEINVMYDGKRKDQA